MLACPCIGVELAVGEDVEAFGVVVEKLILVAPVGIEDWDKDCSVGQSQTYWNRIVCAIARPIVGWENARVIQQKVRVVTLQACISIRGACGADWNHSVAGIAEAAVYNIHIES